MVGHLDGVLAPQSGARLNVSENDDERLAAIPRGKLVVPGVRAVGGHPIGRPSRDVKRVTLSFERSTKTK